MHKSLLLLCLSTLTLAIPQYGAPDTSTCAASTPVTFTHKTVIHTVVTRTTLAPRRCPSFSTRIDAPAPWSSCAFDTATCIRPLCLRLETITQPCVTDECCTDTATETLYNPCPTECPRGCATAWTVVDACVTSTTGVVEAAQATPQVTPV